MNKLLFKQGYLVVQFSSSRPPMASEKSSPSLQREVQTTGARLQETIDQVNRQVERLENGNLQFQVAIGWLLISKLVVFHLSIY